MKGQVEVKEVLFIMYKNALKMKKYTLLTLLTLFSVFLDININLNLICLRLLKGFIVVGQGKNSGSRSPW